MTSLMITGRLTNSRSSRDEKARDSGSTNGQKISQHYQPLLFLIDF